MRSTEAPAPSICSDGTLSLPEAIEFTGLGRSELYLRMDDGRLPFVKHGRRRLIPRRALVQMLEAGLVNGPEGAA